MGLCCCAFCVLSQLLSRSPVILFMCKGVWTCLCIPKASFHAEDSHTCCSSAVASHCLHQRPLYRCWIIEFMHQYSPCLDFKTSCVLLASRKYVCFLTRCWQWSWSGERSHCTDLELELLLKDSRHGHEHCVGFRENHRCK